MGIYFRFKSEESCDLISMNDPYISVVSFKQKVYELRYNGRKNSGLCMGSDFDIAVFNAQTNDCYTDKMLIPNHTSVVIQRVPGGRRCKFINTLTIVVPGSQIPQSSSSNNSISASTSSTVTSTSSSSRGDTADAFGKNVEEAEKFNNFPDELVCRLCKRPMKDAAFTSKCCFDSFCDRCIRDHLTVSNFVCVCGAIDMLTDYLIPNITVRGLIRSMLQSGYIVSQKPHTFVSTSAGKRDRVALPQTTPSADVPTEQPQIWLPPSECARIRAAAEEEAMQQKAVACETGKKKRKQENSENVEATERSLMRTGFHPYNSFGMNINGYTSFGVQ